MSGRRTSTNDQRQGDLFSLADARALYPVHAPKGVVTASTFKLRLAQAISEALKDSGKSRDQIAFEMTTALGEPVSVHMLNAYASPAREEHDISVTRLGALIHATGAVWLWEIATEGHGLTILAGEDAIYAQRGLVRKQMEDLKKRDRELAALSPLQPHTISARARGRR
ncbi:hypothetical protein sos41_31610 [Alphaproteobacteria bacterium SO-S41]|nr:hypothetical protein sos41_31610 [Alphaproteobacteria bacterium SO-S41]